MNYTKLMATASILLMMATAFAGLNMDWTTEDKGVIVTQAPRIDGFRGTGYLDDGNLTGCMSNATDGDTIYVSEGVHTIEVEDGFNKSVTIIGNGTGATLDHGANALYLGANCTFVNINFSASGAAALTINSSSLYCNFTNCTIYTDTTDGAIIGAERTGMPTILSVENCTIEGDVAFIDNITINNSVLTQTVDSDRASISTGSEMNGYVNFSTFHGISGVYGNLSLVNSTVTQNISFTSDVGDSSIFHFVNSSLTGYFLANGPVAVYGLNTSFAELGPNANISYYMPAHIIVDGIPSQVVMIQTGPGINATNGVATTDAYGRANFTDVFQGYANSDGYYNQTYIYKTAIPSGWDFEDINVTSADHATQPLYFFDMHDGNMTWFGNFNNWVVTNVAKSLDLRTSNATSYVEPAVNLTANDLNAVNLNVSLEFHTFNFTLSNFTNAVYGDIPARNYTLNVYRMGEFVTSVATTNGSACWSGTLPFGYSYETRLQMPVPAYAIAGNYTANYNLTATNGPTATDSGTYTLRVLGTPAINGTPTLGQSTVLYPSGLLAGSISDIDSLNNYQVNNTGTAQLDQVQFIFEDMICGTERINISDSLTVYNALTSQSVTSSDGYANLSFSAWLASPVPSRTFQFSISEIPSATPNGTYVGNFTIRAKSGSTWSNTLSGNHTIRVNGTFVQVTLGYTKDPTFHPEDDGSTSVTYGTMAPGATNVEPKNWFIVKNNGNVAITRLEMLVSDLNNATEAAKIDMDSNGYVVDFATGVHYNIGASNDITVNTNIAPNASQFFKLCISAIPGGAMSCTYTGGFTVTAIHTPGSRTVGEGELWDTVASYIGTEGNSTDLAVLMTDYSSIVNFTSPLEEGQEADNQLIIRNNGLMPFDSLILVLNSTSPASYYVEDAYGSTFAFNATTMECPVTLSRALGIGQWLALRFFVSDIDASYDSTHNYTEAQTVNVSGVRSFGLLYPEIVQGGALAVTVNGVVGSATTSAGRNYITVPNNDGNIRSALDILNLTGVVWVAVWDTDANSWDYAFGASTNFALSAGQGVIVYTSIAVEIEFAGTVPALVNVSIQSGLTLTGNPTGSGLYASDLNSSEGVVWISQGDDGEYDYYFPSNPTASTNFYIPAYGAFWARATDSATIVEEE